MKLESFIVGLLFGFLSLVPMTSAKPNVILIITDDQGYGDFGAHGNTVIQTPNLDRLHAESVHPRGVDPFTA